MATVWFVKDGEGDEHTNHTPHRVDINLVTRAVGKHELKFMKAGPIINPGRKASWVDSYKHIVVEVGADEVNQRFEKPGFYYVIGLLPADAEVLFNIPNP